MIGRKLKDLINRKGRDELSEVCEEIGITVNALYTIFKLDRVLSQKVLDYVHRTYPTFNFNWWFYDIGSKWLEPDSNKTEIDTTTSPTVDEVSAPSATDFTDIGSMVYTDPELLELIEEDKRLQKQLKDLLKKRANTMRSQVSMLSGTEKIQGDNLGKLDQYLMQTGYLQQFARSSVIGEA